MIGTNKHAYLIMAHGSEEILKILLELLDDVRNDIFIHIDKKCKSIDASNITNAVKKSKVFFIKSMDCRWGEFSLVECELQLIKRCLKTGICYQYIHLLSGVDLPIKTQDEIHSFFEEYSGDEFINIEEIDTKETNDRLSWYQKDKSNTSYVYSIKCRLLNIFIDRTKKYRNYKLTSVKTSQWFSITYDCARYIYSKRNFIKRHFNSTDCPDEMFLGTVLYGTIFWNNLNKKYEYKNGNMSNMRLIDWKRGQKYSPYTFTYADKELLENSPMLFARKFSEENKDIAFYMKNLFKKNGGE